MGEKRKSRFLVFTQIHLKEHDFLKAKNNRKGRYITEECTINTKIKYYDRSSVNFSRLAFLSSHTT